MRMIDGMHSWGGYDHSIRLRDGLVEETPCPPPYIDDRQFKLRDDVQAWLDVSCKGEYAVPVVCIYEDVYDISAQPQPWLAATGELTRRCEIIQFEDGADAMMFKLAWGGTL